MSVETIALVLIVGCLWCSIIMVQSFFVYDLAYRYTKQGGDNGVALMGWLSAFGLATLVPGLILYYRIKSKEPSFFLQRLSPGWYEYPQVPGLLRWWDGQQWTMKTATINYYW